MIYQLHHQDVSNLDETVFVAQAEPPLNVDLAKFLHEWIEDVKSRYPLPEGWQWLCCTEGYEHFKVGISGAEHGR